ncbi:hypothetical protein [Methylogaea oryzae]|nr:hypothetical protein [Methylogaea oryzae]
MKGLFSGLLFASFSAMAEEAQAGSLLEQNYWLGIVVLVLLVIIFRSGGSKSASNAAPVVRVEPVQQAGEAPAETGVAKYLRAAEGASAQKAAAALTGVARYIQNRDSSAR